MEIDERVDEFKQLVEAHLRVLMERGYTRERAFEILKQRLVDSKRAAFKIAEHD